ncbi:MAG: hypothetical protein FJX47_16520 [Alphaproteobacteria bacterium]|nr:hypothetical protein [Alphaproteobacteria bacterium]
MAPGQDIILDSPLFTLVNFGLAALQWTCIGRFLLGFAAARQPNNYIWVNFCRLTDWLIVAVSWITPRYIHIALLAPVAALWVFLLRLALLPIFWVLGMVPSITPLGGG